MDIKYTMYIGFLLGTSTAIFFLSIIVMGVVKHDVEESLDVKDRYCYYSSTGSTRPCDLAVAVGVLSLLGSMLATGVHVVEFLRIKTLSIVSKPMVMYVRAAVSAFLAFLWLVTFGVLTHDWNGAIHNNDVHPKRGAARAGIAFSFFSMLAWIGAGVATFLLSRVFSELHYGTKEKLEEPTPDSNLSSAAATPTEAQPPAAMEGALPGSAPTGSSQGTEAALPAQDVAVPAGNGLEQPATIDVSSA